MARLLSLLSLAAILCVALANNSSSIVAPSMPMTNSVTPSKAVASTSVAPTSMTSMAKTSSEAPKPTPNPTPNPTPEPADKNYFLNNTDKTVCLHMKAGLALKFMYKRDNKNVSFDVDFSNKTAPVFKHGDSYCNATEQMAVLKLGYTPKGQTHPYYVTFHFNAFKSTWNVSEIMVEFTYNATNFPGYNGTNPANPDLSSTSKDKLFDGGDVGLNKSFSCDVSRTIDGFSLAPYNIYVSLDTVNLQVQAFDFKNPTSGEFDSGVLCAEANTGNKIVPIAVGAALAGLVIVVLIAYLIGRLRNRKKSSYEALS